MHGQGSPHTSGLEKTSRTRHGKCAQVRIGTGLLRCAVILSLLLPAAVSAQQDVSIRLWVAWGGGSARRWSGSIQIQSAQDRSYEQTNISELRSVGLKPDEPGSIYLDDQTVRVAPRSPRSYDAASFLLETARDASLVVSLIPDGDAETARQIQVPVVDLIGGSHTSPLDDQGNQLLIRRAPGDQLRVRFSKESFVFSTGEPAEFFVDPHLIQTDQTSGLVCTMQLFRARSDDSVWREERELVIQPNGEASEIGPVALTMPTEEGVYDVRIKLNRRRLPTRFAPAKVLYERTVQLVVIGDQRPVPHQANWQILNEIAPRPDEGSTSGNDSRSQIWNPLTRLPQWKWLPGGESSPSEEPLGNGKSKPLSVGGRQFVELAANGWQAYPLAIGRVGAPHILEVEYPNDFAQTFGISILTPNAAGIVAPITLDSGVDIPAVDPTMQARIERHRIVFWPRTATPVLLLTNRRNDRPAVFGQIRVLNGPEHLPAQSSPCDSESRLVGAYYDRPAFPENFTASDVNDPLTGRNLNDWVTFYQGGSRMAEYLRYVGFNSAMLSVLHEGGAIYPSDHLASTPRFDNGVFFLNGQDPKRKDVLEMLFRIFDREGLKLIPTLQFSTPLPELEAQLRESPASAGATIASEGIELIGPDGRTWQQRAAEDETVGPRYNPLDHRVQQAMRLVVDDLIQRYAHHAAFGGVAIQLGPQTYSQLPDAQWGWDRRTLSEFARDAQVTVPGLATGDRKQQLGYITVEGQQKWLNWRARRLADFYQRLQGDLTIGARGSRLYLAGGDMLQGVPIQPSLQPRLPERRDLADVLLRVGFSPDMFPSESDLVLLRPRRIAPLVSLTEQAVNVQLNQSRQLDQLLATTPIRQISDFNDATPQRVMRRSPGSLFLHEPQSLAVPEFDAVSPFGADKTNTWLFSHIAPAGRFARERFIHAIATMDSHCLFDGGWMSVMGQHEPVADLLAAYRALPADRFEDISPRESTEQSTVVRTLAKDGRTYIYVANDSPRPVTVNVQIAADGPVAFQALGRRSLPPLAPDDDSMVWKVQLEPFDLIAASFAQTQLTVTDWNVQVSREAFVQLRKELDDVRQRAHALPEVKPLPSPENPSFELPTATTALPGWYSAQGDGITVRLDPNEHHTGGNSLAVESTGPITWVRSNPFPAPETGRLSVWVWMKIADEKTQPPLRLAIEGRLNDRTYYRPAEVGAKVGNSTPPPLTTAWAPYLLRIDDLPPTGLTDLRIAIDLMGKGKVWIDDVQVFDLWFDQNERTELLKAIGMADLSLGKGEVGKCERFLNGYWPEFLRRYVPLSEPQVAANPAVAPSQPDVNSSPTSGDRTTVTDEAEASTSWLDRIVPSTPKLPRFFR